MGQPQRRYLPLLGLLTAVYFLAGRLGLSFAFVNASASAVWPPTGIAVAALPRIRALAPSAHLCMYGLYAAMNAPMLSSLGVDTLLGGEFETGLVSLARRLRNGWATLSVRSSANLALATQRTGPSGKPQPPFRKLDWIFVRGVTPDQPKVIPALDAARRPISDHEILALDVLLDPEA